MDTSAQVTARLQNNAVYKTGRHDFQADIETIAASETVGPILETVMLATGMRFVAVARVTQDRWVTCRSLDEIEFGLIEGDEIDVRSTFCQTVRDTAKKIMFNDSTEDEIYRNHPVAAQYGIVSYASIPIFRTNGSFFGTLCALDTVPRKVTHARAIAMFEMFAKLIGRMLETEEQLKAQEELVRHERKLAEARDEFVAILGHDLRNPVAALTAGIRQLGREHLSERGLQVLELMRPTLLRMDDLIENMMLHAKSRLGGGIKIAPKTDAPLAEAIAHAVEEVRAAEQGRDITLDLAFPHPVRCDAPRLAQALSNLISNAVKHGAQDSPIEVRGYFSGVELVLAVVNRGEAIPEDVQRRLFQPFQRGESAESDGLGLGLYIASSIATAHGGRVELICDGGCTTFALKLPSSGIVAGG
ncbi:GAF domain-containing sensor histidine kinase [Roseibium marinum]|uniref:histidine kinase n=1 Tax=Roseibium marinum TaxID=281252 RepID=A0A2S3UNQ0_9HYPH|nr:GAF domain-containing sensor histidine kinase [Roseibium marinum]POF29321.1 signal transduction histidine kinase [Roseibium marinum]